MNQIFQDFEIVIVDDGSTDKSVEIVKSISDNRIKLYQKENGGVSSARNYGIKKSQYDYIAFLDADDHWEPNYLEELVKMINDFPEAGMWGFGYQKIGNFEKGIKREIVQYRGILTNYWKFQPPSCRICNSTTF